MQKKLIALAIAGLATSAAFAQSNVTIYGRVDYGFMNRNGDSGGVQNSSNKHEFASGIASGSRIGFKGAEDLGNGLKAIFELEYSLAVDQGTTAATTWGNRHSYVGVTGNFGTVIGGRLDGVRYGVFTTYDPFGGGSIGNFTQMTRQVDRADNAIAYVSPKWNGFGAVLAYSTNIAGTENASNTGDLRLNTIMGTYDNGPISIKLDYETIKSQGTDGKIRVTTLGGSYDLGVVKLSALYDFLKDDIAGRSDEDKRAWLVGARAPVGNFTLKGSYGRVQDKANGDADASKWALGVDYALSKRTNLYANYGMIRNDDNASYRISQSANQNVAAGGTGTAALAGGLIGVRGVDVGIAHNF